MHRVLDLPFKISGLICQILLMGLLGVSGVIFVPILLNIANPQLIADILVAQVYVYYFSVLVQYGFALSGPVAVAKAVNSETIAQLIYDSVRGKLLLLVAPLFLMFVIVLTFKWGDWYILLFGLLLTSYAFNSNWYLQAQQRFLPAVAFAAIGVLISSVLVYGGLGDGTTSKSITGVQIVLILILPQVFVGVGTWRVARSTCLAYSSISRRDINLRWIGSDAPLVASQLLQVASTTFGTVVVGGLADAGTTAAYAATEKLFNLVATVLIGLFMGAYPRLADLYYLDRRRYWRTTQLLLLICTFSGLVLASLFALFGTEVLAMYLPIYMVEKVVPALWPLGLWLGLCVSQHVLTGYLVLSERHHIVLLANACVFFVTLVVGYSCARVLSLPVAWVFGMVAGQVLSLLWLHYMARQNKNFSNENFAHH